jgi:hypothetical protein
MKLMAFVGFELLKYVPKLGIKWLQSLQNPRTMSYPILSSRLHPAEKAGCGSMGQILQVPRQTGIP